MLEGHYPLGFKLALHHKDLGIALEAAEAAHIDLPVSSLVQRMEQQLMDAGYSDDDVAALHCWNSLQHATGTIDSATGEECHLHRSSLN